MTKLSIQQAQDLERALSTAVEYLTDNSCSDPACCGGPYVSEEDYSEVIDALQKYGLEVVT